MAVVVSKVGLLLRILLLQVLLLLLLMMLLTLLLLVNLLLYSPRHIAVNCLMLKVVAIYAVSLVLVTEAVAVRLCHAVVKVVGLVCREVGRVVGQGGLGGGGLVVGGAEGGLDRWTEGWTLDQGHGPILILNRSKTTLNTISEIITTTT